MKNEEIKLVLEQMDSKLFMIFQYLQRIMVKLHSADEIAETTEPFIVTEEINKEKKEKDIIDILQGLNKPNKEETGL